MHIHVLLGGGGANYNRYFVLGEHLPTHCTEPLFPPPTLTNYRILLPVAILKNPDIHVHTCTRQRRQPSNIHTHKVNSLEGVATRGSTAARE